jgi:UDP-glucuronate 4-epimerase
MPPACVRAQRRDERCAKTDGGHWVRPHDRRSRPEVREIIGSETIGAVGKMTTWQKNRIQTPFGSGPVLVTGAAGFIGFHLTRALLNDGYPVIGVDNLNEYYDVNLKLSRLALLKERTGFSFVRGDIAEKEPLIALFRQHGFPLVLHMAAQAGVRYSIENPHAYTESNIQGFLNILEGCRLGGVRHLLYASSSSVYGANGCVPFSVHHNVDHPVSLYAATKKANELMAHSYSSLYGIPCSGLRLFTVYGPWGRPDMAIFSFTRAILEGRPIEVYREGRMHRDFTYIDDAVDMITRIMHCIPAANAGWDSHRADPATSAAPFRIYNLGNSRPVNLMDLVAILEKHLGRKAVIRWLPAQPGDMVDTCADMTDTEGQIGKIPRIALEDGLRRFVDWYRDYCGLEFPERDQRTASHGR